MRDTTIAACDDYRYRNLGAQGYHDNCTENLVAVLGALGLALPEVPCPFNLWEKHRQMVPPPLAGRG